MIEIPADNLNPQSDDYLYVSPTSDDTLKERYEKVKAKEAQLTNEERLRAIRTPSPLFPDERPIPS